MQYIRNDNSHYSIVQLRKGLVSIGAAFFIIDWYIQRAKTSCWAFGSQRNQAKQDSKPVEVSHVHDTTSLSNGSQGHPFFTAGSCLGKLLEYHISRGFSGGEQVFIPLSRPVTLSLNLVDTFRSVLADH